MIGTPLANHFAQSGGNVDGSHVSSSRAVSQSRTATTEIKLHLLGE